MDKKRILLVDDEPGFAKVLKVYLEHHGTYEVRAETDGTHCLAIAREFRPNLILLDLIMPHIDGSTLASEFGTDEYLKEIPIVFLTAAVADEEVDSLEGMFCGHPLISKSRPLNELVEWIGQHLKGLPG